MPRPSNTVERRAQIVDALLAVIAERGYADATVAAIASRAGLATGLVHYHFASKHAVLVALVETLSARLEARVQAAAASTPEARLDAVLGAYVELGPGADARAVAAWVVIGGEAARDVEVRQVFEGAVRRALVELERCVSAVLGARGHSTVAAAEIARTLYTTIEGCYRLGAAVPGVLPTGSAATMLQGVAHALTDSAGHRLALRPGEGS